MPNCNYNGYDFGMQGITTMFKADASNLVNSNGNKVVQAGKSLQGMYGNVALKAVWEEVPTTVPETTVAPQQLLKLLLLRQLLLQQRRQQ